MMNLRNSNAGSLASEKQQGREGTSYGPRCLKKFEKKSEDSVTKQINKQCSVSQISEESSDSLSSKSSRSLIIHKSHTAKVSVSPLDDDESKDGFSAAFTKFKTY